ncbi:MAG TPA: hypothetical protein VIH85_06270 [Solirubrobacteraceae bacterium]
MRRGSRLAIALPVVACLAAIVVLATAGSHAPSHRAPARIIARPHGRAPVRNARATRRAIRVNAQLIGTLPSAVQDSAVAPLGQGRVVLLGGIDAAQSSTDAITIIDGGTARTAGALPGAQHDAQAALLGAQVYVFGGGEFTEYDHILRYDTATGQVTTAGRLPTPASDVAVAAIGDTAYVVGGYDGVHPLDTIVAWRSGETPHVVARLPAGLRYAAVAAAGRRLIIAGGEAGDAQVLSDAVYSFDPASRAVRRIGRLPVPLTHAAADDLDGQVLVVGGRRELAGEQTNAILAVDPSTGHVAIAGRLPTPLSDAMVATTADDVIVAGGESPSGAQRSVFSLLPRIAR